MLGEAWNSPQGMASPTIPTWVSWLSVLNGHNLSSLFKVGIKGLDRHCSDWRSSRMAYEPVPWSRKHQSQQSITDHPESVAKSVANMSWTLSRSAGPLHLLLRFAMYFLWFLCIMRRCERLCSFCGRLERASTPALAWQLFFTNHLLRHHLISPKHAGALYTLCLN